MAMNIGGSGEDEPMMEINTTPLIDVMLVLLVMLIITIPIQLHAVYLRMPVGVPPSSVQPQKVRIDIDARSVVYWQGSPVDAAQLDEKMAQIAQQPVPPDIHIRPDKDSRYAVFAHVLSVTRRMGLDKVAVIGAEQFGR